jgi:hypothetical protein
MRNWKAGDRHGLPGTLILVGLSCLALSAVGAADDKKKRQDTVPLTVTKATCGPNDHPETALQGQVPASMRASGFKGFNCNLELIAQSRGDGANWQSAEYRDPVGNGSNQGKAIGQPKGIVCAYHGTAFTTAGRKNVGVPVIDITNENYPTPTEYLTSISMLDPWESLKVNNQRKLLAADNGHNGGGGAEVDIYDLSGDCRFPQLLASVAVGKADGSTGVPAQVIGHEGYWAPDGMTYYVGSPALRSGNYYAVDTSDPTAPKLIATYTNPLPGGSTHGLSISDDGNRAYFATRSVPAPTDVTNPNFVPTNGVLIADVSEIQSRLPNPKIKLISSIIWRDGSVMQHTIPVKIHGKPYLIAVDEGGSAGVFPGAWEAACAAGVPPFPMARIINISDEKNPKLVARLGLETHDPANCAAILPDVVGLSLFSYGSHYCSVDNKEKATTLACGYFDSGIRVFDIRDPVDPKEIAYYNPAGTATPSPGSNHVTNGQWRAGSPDWCTAQVHLDADRGTLWTTCHDNGLLMLKFTNNAWPLPESKTPPGEQN